MYFVATSVDTIYEDVKVCEQQVDQAAAMGVNLLRWQIIQGFEEPKFQEYGEYIRFVHYVLDKYDRCRDYIKSKGMKVSFVKMHPFGGYSGHKMLLFKSMKNYSRNLLGFIKVWKYIAERYKDDEVIEGFELLNEPQVASTRGYLNGMQQVVDELRKITDKTLIINCPGTTPDGFIDMKPLKGKNLYYGFHFYEPRKITHQKEGLKFPYRYISDRDLVKSRMRYALRFQKKFLAPVVNTEFACTSLYEGNQERYVADLVSVFNELGISYAYHNVSNVKDNIWQLKDGAKNVFVEKAKVFLDNYK